MKTKIANYGIGLLAGLFVLAQTGFGATKHEQNVEKSFAATAGGKLVIDSDRGSIEVTTDGEDKIQVRVFRQVNGGTQADADALFANRSDLRPAGQHDIGHRQKQAATALVE